MTCRDVTEMVEERIDRVLTQYRESPKLLFLLRTYLTKAAELHQEICDLPEKFNIEIAVGDQLTIIGKRLGWGRCHCICDIQPVFGFECDGVVSSQPLAGFCNEDSTWAGCGEFGTGEICIVDDDLYRRFLKVRLYQFLGLFDIASLEESVKIFWGDAAQVLSAGVGRVVVTPGRDLTETEVDVLQLYSRVMPLALGVEARFHFGRVPVFGFGEGWGGFCEEWKPGGLPLADELGNILVDESGNELWTGPLTRDADWMCEIDVHPYNCI